MEKETVVSNYDRLCEEWRMKFLQLDQERLMRCLPEIKAEGEYLTLRHFSRKFGVHRTKGQIVSLEDGQPISNSTRLNIYNLFWFVRDEAVFLNEWVPFRDVKNASPFSAAFDRNVRTPFARTFTGKTAALHQAARQLGAAPLEQGDVGFELKAFDCIPMRFLFWDADEEFPAQANILFDRGVTDFIHVESTVSLATEGIAALIRAAGVKLQGNLFDM